MEKINGFVTITVLTLTQLGSVYCEEYLHSDFIYKKDYSLSEVNEMLKRLNLDGDIDDYITYDITSPPFDDGAPFTEIEVGLMNNKGYPNNVTSVLYAKNMTQAEVMAFFKQFQRNNKTFLVTVQDNNKEIDSVYIEIDENAVIGREEILEVLKKLEEWKLLEIANNPK